MAAYYVEAADCPDPYKNFVEHFRRGGLFLCISFEMKCVQKKVFDQKYGLFI